MDKLMANHFGKYSLRLGIHVDDREPKELFKWLLASVLFGAPISSETAERTYHEMMDSGINTPQRVLDAEWEGLVAELDAGGYTRYDYKTADKLLEVSTHLLRDYAGDLNRLHDTAEDGMDLIRRIKALGKGVGDVAANIFLRELRGIWPKATPGISKYALNAARGLGLVKEGEDPALALMKAWGKGMPGKDFRDFEAALVSHGIEMRRKKAA